MFMLCWAEAVATDDYGPLDKDIRAEVGKIGNLLGEI